MHLVPLRIEASCDGSAWSARLAAAGAARLGPLEVTIGEAGSWPSLSWSVANRGDRPVSVRSVAVVFALAATEPLRMFRHGYQSWSASGVATFGVDVDPSTVARFEFLQAVHHADQRAVTAPGELRSEWVTVLADARGDLVLAGFVSGTEHDGTFRLRRAPHAQARADDVELWAEAFLGDAVLAGGEHRNLHGVAIYDTGGSSPATVDDIGGSSQMGTLRGRLRRASGVSRSEHEEAGAAVLLERWAATAGRATAARVSAPYQVGWCSWYQYFGSVTEGAFLANLARAADWPFDVFQLDDGYQSAIGDWLTTNETFPAGLRAVAEAVEGAGLRPGLWLAPFLAGPDSRLAGEHPEWLARPSVPHASDEPLYAWWNPLWGGERSGFVFALDTTNPEVLDHLERTARSLVELGFSYLKLDFTFAPSIDGRWADPGRTPAQRVRAGFEAVRRGAGEDAFIVACGAPLAHVVGVVDGARIGPDVAPLWGLNASDEIVPGYLDVQPSTRGAYGATVARSFMHRRLWLNDPDCLMLRSSQTALSHEAATTWARTVGLSGGMTLVSDDLSLLGAGARSALDETLEAGRANDEAARVGVPTLASDLMAHNPPTTFAGRSGTLVTDPASGSSTLTGPGAGPG